jgi:hypothetical protein
MGIHPAMRNHIPSSSDKSRLPQTCTEERARRFRTRNLVSTYSPWYDSSKLSGQRDGHNRNFEVNRRSPRLRTPPSNKHGDLMRKFFAEASNCAVRLALLLLAVFTGASSPGVGRFDQSGSLRRTVSFVPMVLAIGPSGIIVSRPARILCARP